MNQATSSNPVSLTEKPKATRFIGRHKKCGFVVAVDMPKTERRGTRQVWGVRGWQPEFYTYAKADRPAFMTCPNCKGHSYVTFSEVDGRVSEKHKCDARCLNAIGPDCECSCGGANHGAAHLQS